MLSGVQSNNGGKPVHEKCRLFFLHDGDRMLTVAVIGGGLAGLAAAYSLRGSARVTLFEKATRIGGRVLTSTTPRGEHGAEYFLGTETTINTLLRGLNIKAQECRWEWPAYAFGGRIAKGDPQDAANRLLGVKTGKHLGKLFVLAKSPGKPKEARFSAFAWKLLEGDPDSIRFATTLLAGETCSPPEHLSTDYALASLWSAVEPRERWYRVAEGTQHLVDALRFHGRPSINLHTKVTTVRQDPGGIRVTWTGNDGPDFQVFDSAIVATPHGESLVGLVAAHHFHSYISILLSYDHIPCVVGRSDVSLADGLYVDGFANYVNLVPGDGPPFFLRVLIPCANAMLGWPDSTILRRVVQALHPYLLRAGQHMTWSIKKWKYGLPCGGEDRLCRVVASNLVLAGDRFSKFPSMNGAIESGFQAASTIRRALTI